MAKRFKAAIIGGSGYGGAEMARRLLLHPDVELVRVASIDHVGEPVAAVHPNLEGATDLKFEKLAPREAAEGMDIAFLALPRGISGKEMPGLLETGARIIDMHRPTPTSKSCRSSSVENRRWWFSMTRTPTPR